MGFKPTSETDTEDIKKRLLSMIETIDSFGSCSYDIKEIDSGDHKTIMGKPVMKKREIKLEFIAHTEEYPNPELKKE